jgi:hypothetical protein
MIRDSMFSSPQTQVSQPRAFKKALFNIYLFSTG